ncbi:MAG TPA: hypothetical protein VJ385_10850 [Fibrobacteria bacterium]|nr:hypothetical protein [Fibrobacteria bacterium]
MRNFLKNVDMDQVKDQIADIKDQVQDLRFRKPWTKGSETSPAAFMAIGAALAVLGVTLYRNRGEVAHFCSNCGAEIKGRWESSGMKEKAEKFMGKMKNGVQEAKSQANQERYQPT